MDRKLRVLVIDDEPLIGRAIQRSLPEVSVETVTLAAEGLQRCQAEDFDIVFCDILMPGLNGREVYQQLKASHPDRAKRFVFMTGGSFVAWVQRFIEEVSNEVLLKPFSRNRLQAVVENVRANLTPPL